MKIVPVATSIGVIENWEEDGFFHLRVLHHDLKQLRVAPGEFPNLHPGSPHGGINRLPSATCRQILRPPNHSLHVPQHAGVLHPRQARQQRRRFVLPRVPAPHGGPWEPRVDETQQRLA